MPKVTKKVNTKAEQETKTVSTSEVSAQPVMEKPAENQTSASQPAQKINIWKWLLIGCLVIVVLLLLVAGGCSYLAYKATKEIGSEIQEELEKGTLPAKIQEELEKQGLPEEVRKELEKQGLEMSDVKIPENLPEDMLQNIPEDLPKLPSAY